jgi:hypothetical protein
VPAACAAPQHSIMPIRASVARIAVLHAAQKTETLHCRPPAGPAEEQSGAGEWSDAPLTTPAHFVIVAQLAAVSRLAELNRLNRNDFR